METADAGPWKKQDPVKLRREAEAKEAKLKRQQEQRILRAEARKEKRHAKSEAKQARKANVGRAGKWNAERKAADKLKKLANRPHKQEKRRKRLRLRADKLEAQAIKLMADAQKARVRADYLDELKEKEEAEKNKLTREIEQLAADPDNDEFIPLDDAAPAATTKADDDKDDDGGAAVSKKKAVKKQKKEAKLQEQDAVPIKHEEPSSSTSVNGLDVESQEKKQKKKDAKKAEKRKRKAEDDLHEEPNGTAEADVAPQAEAPKEEKKKKKRKLEEAVNDAGSLEESNQVEAHKEKKDKKKRKEKRHAEEYVPTATAEGTNANGGEQWNAEALEGGDKRKNKFLRLLGANKSNGTATDSNYAPTSKAYITQMQNDLERQFDTGMKMKHEGQGQKRGLGA